ncbi:MAG: tRNA pseudouridine(38-40) synthase TruA [Bacteroidetes bacterium]|nr:MAG: tRNA pseudouridine(38-40) synthase TruA [Bacteroidota bacterium]
MRYFIKLSYKGTNYHGWQTQPNAISVQEELEKAFSLILRKEIAITGAGRTDAGVHAKNFIAHFETEKSFNTTQVKELIYKLNSYISKDLAIHDIYKVDDRMHARFDAKERTYQYFITTTKNPFATDSAWYVYGKLDVDKMNLACDILKEYSDFGSFAKLHSDNKTNICDLMEAHWEFKDELLVFTIKADRFLRNMVRAIVGTMVDIGQGKTSLDELSKIIESKDRNRAGRSVPGYGLFLVEIKY